MPDKARHGCKWREGLEGCSALIASQAVMQPLGLSLEEGRGRKMFLRWLAELFQVTLIMFPQILTPI